MDPQRGTDQETQAYKEALSRTPLSQRHLYVGLIEERESAFLSGIQRVDGWKQERIQKFDPELRLRWDYPAECYCVDKWVPQIEVWVVLMLWRYADTHLARPLGEEGLRELIAVLHNGDMQRWPSPEAYLKFRREQSAAIRKSNENDATEQVLAAVDNLSKKQIAEFIAVETAFKTGEKVISHGKQETWLEKLRRRTRQREAAGDVVDNHVAINPGQSPKNYFRQPRKEREG